MNFQAVNIWYELFQKNAHLFLTQPFKGPKDGHITQTA